MSETIPTAQLIFDHFPDLTDQQRQQFEALDALYRDWNAKINVISRKDIDNLYSHHILHSLGIAKVIRFRPESTIMDVGTGGGFYRCVPKPSSQQAEHPRSVPMGRRRAWVRGQSRCLAGSTSAV